MSTTAQLERMINWNANRNTGYARGYRAAFLKAAELCIAESERFKRKDAGKMQRSAHTRARGARRCATILRALVMETPGVLNHMIEKSDK